MRLTAAAGFPDLLAGEYRRHARAEHADRQHGGRDGRDLLGPVWSTRVHAHSLPPRGRLLWPGLNPGDSGAHSRPWVSGEISRAQLLIRGSQARILVGALASLAQRPV